MSGYQNPLKCVFALTFILASSSVSIAETWHLEQGKIWEPLDNQTQDKLLLEAAKIKDSLNKGEVRKVRDAWNKIKGDFPEIKGDGLDAFIKAEILFAEDKFIKAVNSYDKFLSQFPESKLYQVALDREFAIANAFLAGRKLKILKLFKIKGYAQGEKIMDKIIDYAPDMPIAKKAAVAVAESYEKRKKFENAYQRWSEVYSKWSAGKTGQIALLKMARCKYAAYGGPRYDASDLISAKTYYENFKLKYPQNAQKIGIPEKIKNINELLAEKKFKIADFYERTGNTLAANLYYRMIVDEDKWSETTAAKLACEKLENN